MSGQLLASHCCQQVVQVASHCCQQVVQVASHCCRQLLQVASHWWSSCNQVVQVVGGPEEPGMTGEGPAEGVSSAMASS